MSAFCLLISTVLLTWHARLRPLAIGSFCLFLVAGVYLNRLQLSAVGIAVILAALIHSSQHPNHYRKLVGSVFMVVLTLLLFVHRVPGFNNIKVWDAIQLSSNSAPFTLFLNFDKPLFAVLFLLFFGKRLTLQSTWPRYVAGVSRSLLPLICILVPVGMATRFITFDPKFTTNYILWAVNNLLVVCVGEEVFFRGYIQSTLCTLFSRWTHGEWASLILASLFFGAAHFAGGLGYVVLSSLAGFFYGLAYNYTRTIEASVLVHFLLNSIHFLFFSYPYYWTAS